jgi:hypothetical protein
LGRNNNREDRLIESLQNQIRELKKENRRLHKINKTLNKGYRKMVETEVVEEEEIPVEIQKLCWECSGEYKLIEIAGRRFRQCQECGKRGKVTLV